MMETQTAFMAAAVAAGLLAAVLTERRDGLALRYAALACAFGLWALGRGAAGLGTNWGQATSTLGLALLGPAALAFVRGLPEQQLDHARRDTTLLWSGALLIAVTTWMLPGPHWPQRVAGIFALAGVGAAGIWLVMRVQGTGPKRTPDAERLGYLVFCQWLLLGGIGLDAGLWLLGAPEIATLTVAIPYLYIGFLILTRVRVGDVRQLLGNALTLCLLAGGLAGFFALLRIWVGDQIDLFIFNAFIASCALLLAYPPLRNRIRRGVDRRLVASKVALEGTLRELEHRLPQLLTLDALLPELLRTLEQTDRVTSSAIYLREDPQVGFQQAASLGLPPRSRVNLIRDPVFTSALATDRVLQREELAKELAEIRAHAAASRSERSEDLERLCQLLDRLDAQIVLVLRAGERVVGFWTLTNARAHEPFSSGELRLLRSVADLAARSIENSKTFEQVRARDRLASLGEMSAGLAHELRNPLATIRTAADMLSHESNGQTGEASEFREVIVEEIARLDRVLAAFLDYARPSTRRSRVENLGDFVRDCVRGTARHHAGDDVELELDIQPDLPAIEADTDQLERVLFNVIQNAYEAVSRGGSIRVYAQADDTNVEIRVEDDGPGMDEATLERAFVPFYTRKDSGTGLGLALCERIVRAHGGTISIRSRSGEGAGVSIHIPYLETPSTYADPAMPAAEAELPEGQAP